MEDRKIVSVNVNAVQSHEEILKEWEEKEKRRIISNAEVLGSVMSEMFKLMGYKSREDVVSFIENQFDSTYRSKREKGGQFHYGRQELRELLDYIYGGEPKGPEQELKPR